MFVSGYPTYPGLALAGRQVAIGYCSSHPAIKIFLLQPIWPQGYFQGSTDQSASHLLISRSSFPIIDIIHKIFIWPMKDTTPGILNQRHSIIRTCLLSVTSLSWHIHISYIYMYCEVHCGRFFQRWLLIFPRRK